MLAVVKCNVCAAEPVRPRFVAAGSGGRPEGWQCCPEGAFRQVEGLGTIEAEPDRVDADDARQLGLPGSDEIADIDLETRLIDPEAVRGKIGPRTRCVITVHMSGMPCDMDTFMALGAETGVKILEDCAQAHGARYRGRSVGTFGDVAAWSFCQDKIMTTGGEGGMVTTDDPGLHRRMWAYKDHGKSWEAVRKTTDFPAIRWKPVKIPK